MEYLVLVIEAIICVASYGIADYMVTHRTGLARRLIIGQDPKAVISEMRGLASTIFYGMKEENVKLKDYTINVTVKNEKITKMSGWLIFGAEVAMGHNEYMTFGEDSTETIERMIELAKEIFSKVEVRSKKTKVICTGEEVSATNTVNTKGEVIAFFTLMSWCAISLVAWVGSLIIFVINIFSQIF